MNAWRDNSLLAVAENLHDALVIDAEVLRRNVGIGAKEHRPAARPFLYDRAEKICQRSKRDLIVVEVQRNHALAEKNADAGVRLRRLDFTAIVPTHHKLIDAQRRHPHGRTFAARLYRNDAIAIDPQLWRISVICARRRHCCCH
jgi:hypothetical protein